MSGQGGGGQAVYDYAKRDAKVARKLALIMGAPPEDRGKTIGQALRALWGFGVAQERERVYTETAWCSQCKGAGYFQLTLLNGCCAAHRGYRNEFCTCERGKKLKDVYEDLGSGKVTFPFHQLVFRRRDREG